MPLYEYKCSECQYVFEGIAEIDARNEPQECPKCSASSPRDVEAELAGMGNVDETCKEHERWSWSMGCQPWQVADMCKRYPGSEYNSKGQLKIKSRKHKQMEMKRRNFEEYN